MTRNRRPEPDPDAAADAAALEEAEGELDALAYEEARSHNEPPVPLSLLDFLEE